MLGHGISLGGWVGVYCLLVLCVHSSPSPFGYMGIGPGVSAV